MEDFFGRNSLLFEYGRNWFVCQNFGFCQDFVSMEKEGRGQEFRSLEVREASSSHLNIDLHFKFILN